MKISGKFNDFKFTPSNFDKKKCEISPIDNNNFSTLLTIEPLLPDVDCTWENL